jgi:hypothetical protein
MEEPAGPGLAPPRALRPAQLGVILVGRVTLGHIGATVVDLAGRGYTRIELVEDGDPDWQITALDAERDGLLDYERTLLRGLFDGPQAIRLGLVSARMIPLLDKVRDQIVRDAAGAGWLGQGLVRRLAHGRLSLTGQGPVRRTKAGEELLKEIKAFRRELRAMAGDGSAGALARYAPYAMVFGLTAPVPTADSPMGEPSDGADPRPQTADFAACWQKAWATAAPFELRFWWEPFQPAGPGHPAVPGHGSHHAYDHHPYHHGGGFDGGHGGGFHGGHA